MPLFASRAQDAMQASAGVLQRLLVAASRSPLGEIELQPFGGEHAEVCKGQFRRIDLGAQTDLRQSSLEQAVAAIHLCSARQRSPRAGPRPIAHDTDHLLDVSAMGTDDLPGNVRYELLIAIRLGVADRAHLALLDIEAAALDARNMPNSRGMLKRGSPETASSSVRERS